MRTETSRTLLSALLLAISAAECFSSRCTPVVHTASGPVQGQILTTVWNSIEYSSFKGIPYGKPPVGNLRFKPPVEPARWSRTLNASVEGNVCPQIDYISKKYLGDENCLFLNVYTRETKFEGKLSLKPVMVWIYGGSFVWGYSNVSLYGPDFFVEEDVVIVTFNYRVGALGFLSLPHPEAMGNAGIKDQVLALQWVQKNIAKFGGDPNRVTIFGESAGGGSVGLHIVSEVSKDLFQQSITMSGTAFTVVQTRKEATDSAMHLARYLNFQSTDTKALLEFFRNASPEELVMGTENMNADTAVSATPFRPLVEDPSLGPGAFLTECPPRLLQRGNFKRHSMMLGYVKDEALFTFEVLSDPRNVTTFLTQLLDAMLKGNPHSSPEFVNEIESWKRKVCEYGVQNVAKVATDLIFVGPMDLTRRLLAKHNGDYPIYFYRTSYESEYQIHKVNGLMYNGTSHFDDIGYLFDVDLLKAPTSPTHPLNRFRKKIVTLWANFAKYGNPTPEVTKSLFNATWLPSGRDGSQFDIDEHFSNGHFIDEYVKIYESILNATLPLEVCTR